MSGRGSPKEQLEQTTCSGHGKPAVLPHPISLVLKCCFMALLRWDLILTHFRYLASTLTTIEVGEVGSSRHIRDFLLVC
jgi:hypothetical protein